MSFNQLGLSEALLKAVSKKGYREPSPIQKKAIPLILDRKDVLASAQTGTGKTAGFTLPMLQILSARNMQGKRPIRSLILTPTRELAAQILENVEEYGIFLDLKATVIFGGVNQNPQISTLKRGVDILIATPGRLLDLESQGFVNLSQVEILVLDEADRMLDMGFLRDIKRVLKLVPQRRQNLLFSATFSKEIKELANGILNNPVLVEATPENTTAEKVTQKAYRIDQERKVDFVIDLISEGRWDQVLIFTRTKHRANRVSEKLEKAGITSAAIHGNKSQAHRTKTLAGFKEGKIRVLVATDIAARGLDIPLLPYVINFELPNIAEDYVHRIGRTARAGASGEAISLVNYDEMDYLKGIEKLLKMKIDLAIVEGFEPDKSLETATPEPKKGRYQGGGGGGRSKPKSNVNNRWSKKPRT